jgi:hypothetical protein
MYLVLACLSIISSSSAFFISSFRGYENTVLQARGFGFKTEFQFSGKLRPGTLSPPLKVPLSIPRPDYADDGVPKAKLRGI